MWYLVPHAIGFHAQPGLTLQQVSVTTRPYICGVFPNKTLVVLYPNANMNLLEQILGFFGHSFKICWLYHFMRAIFPASTHSVKTKSISGGSLHLTGSSNTLQPAEGAQPLSSNHTQNAIHRNSNDILSDISLEESTSASLVTISQAIELATGQQTTNTSSNQAAHTSINAIPSELLEITFKIYLASEAGSIHHLLLVSRRWHSIVAGTAYFWANIKLGSRSFHHLYANADKQVRQIEVYISNSRSLPLDIDINYGFQLSEDNIESLRCCIRRIFVALRADTLRWRSLQVVFPSNRGRSVVSLDDCGISMLHTPELSHLAIEMLATHTNERLPLLHHFADVSRLQSLKVDDEGHLNHLPNPLEGIQILDVRVNQLPFNTKELVRFPSLKTVTLRHEERDHRLQSTFSSDDLAYLWNQLGGRPQSDVVIDGETGHVDALCIQSAWIMESELPDLTPIKLAWDPLTPSPLRQFKFTELAKSSISTLLRKYPLVEYLVLPGGLARPFFILVQHGLVIAQLRSVLFDMESGAPRVYDKVDGRLRRRR